MTYLQQLCLLGETMQLASKCGLGQSAPNAFLSIVTSFQDEILGRTVVRMGRQNGHHEDGRREER